MSVLPAIDEARCLHAISPIARCSACVSACPRNVWRLDDQALRFDAEACDGCGLCVPVCPEQALALPRRMALRREGGTGIALAACDQVTDETGEGVLACVHSLGWRDILTLSRLGMWRLAIAIADCEACQRRGPHSLSEAVESANCLLRDRGLAEVSLCRVDSETWLVARERLARETSRPDPRRRRFLGLTPHESSIDDWLAAEPEQARPFVPEIDPGECEGCDVCVYACPHGALALERDAAGELAYVTHPARCSGCRICRDVCEVGAMSIGRFVRPASRALPLREAKCRACGCAYHTTRPEQADDRLCPICARTRHVATLFQVLE